MIALRLDDGAYAHAPASCTKAWKQAAEAFHRGELSSFAAQASENDIRKTLERRPSTMLAQSIIYSYGNKCDIASSHSTNCRTYASGLTGSRPFRSKCPFRSQMETAAPIALKLEFTPVVHVVTLFSRPERIGSRKAPKKQSVTAARRSTLAETAA